MIEKKLKKRDDAANKEQAAKLKEGDEDFVPESSDTSEDDIDLSASKKRKRGGRKTSKKPKKKRKKIEKEKEKKTKKKKGRSRGKDGDSDSGSNSDVDTLDFKTIRKVSRAIERIVVQKTMGKRKKNDRAEKEKALSESFARCAAAKIGTYDCFGWEQMVADGVRGQRGAVVASVKGIVAKTDIHPNAMVSCINIDYHIISVWYLVN
jgi:hypothetical protein